MRLSIRWRLTLWNTLALAVVLLGFAALVYGLLAHAQQQIDRALRERLDRALQRIDQTLLSEFQQLQKLEQDPNRAGAPDERLRYWIGEFEEHDHVFCVIYDREGKVRIRTEKLATTSIPPAPREAPNQLRYENALVPSLGQQRVLT